MTATPAFQGEPERFEAGVEDRAPDALGKRIFASKPTRLVEGKNRPADLDRLADRLCEEAVALSEAVEGARRIAVMVNRVYTARAVYRKLHAKKLDAHLLIGRMRPLDRDDLLKDLESLRSGAKRDASDEVKFVVSTQCLEVGADLDFDVLVSECASVDALQQRFGRLDRLGDFGRARGSIVMGSAAADAKKSDPIYGDALAETWRWLNEIALNGEVNVGIEASEGREPTVAQRLKVLSEAQRAAMRLEGKPAPVLLPAYLDAWVQTNPQPACEPLVELFLHGQKDGEPDVQVVWRADLEGIEPDQWKDVVGLCPPATAEAMPVPISAFRRWFEHKDADKNDSDLEGAGAIEEARDREEKPEARCDALIWQAKDSWITRDASRIKPGNTIVIPVSAGGVDELGHKPEGSLMDLADRAQLGTKRRLSLRIHAGPLAEWPESAVRTTMETLAKQEDLGEERVREAIEGCLVSEEPIPEWLRRLLEAAKEHRFEVVCYPGSDGHVVQGRGTFQSVEEDSGDDESSRTKPVALEDHLRHVEEAVRRLRALLGDQLAEYEWAARFHDYGKVDIRFQSLLRGGDRMAAQFAPKPLAKSGSLAASPEERKRQRHRAGLPDGFRHEHLSLLFARKDANGSGERRELGFHLIASHHGGARPFAPVADDPEPVEAAFGGTRVSAEERRSWAAHRAGSGVPERFWRLTRRYGWWGLAWHEALFRLADWDASAREVRG